jgi:hypothetical protein
MKAYSQSGKIFLLALSLVAILAVSGLAMAQSDKKKGDGKRHDNDRPPQMTEEQIQAAHKLWGDYSDKIRPLKEDLKDLKLLYEALASNSAANTDEVKKIVSDMRAIRDKIAAERKTFFEEYKKSGLPFGHGEWGRSFDRDGGHGHDRGDFKKHGRGDRGERGHWGGGHGNCSFFDD